MKLINNKTYKALMRRGFSSSSVQKILDLGLTLNNLKQKSEEELEKLDLSKPEIDLVLREKRPPIPEEIISDLLYNCRYTCCICREQGKPIIIHHIVPWEDSKSHNEDNLVILCLEHHDKAHSRSSLSLNLTPDRIKIAKHRWIEFVKMQEREKSIDIIKKPLGLWVTWDYFNIERIMSLKDLLEVDIVGCKYYDELLLEKFIDKHGNIKSEEYWPVKIKEKSYYWLNFMEGQRITYYLASLVLKLLYKSHIKIINETWNKNYLKRNLNQGALILIQGGFYFKEKTNNGNVKNQQRLVYIQKKNIRIESIINPWYACSDSAYCLHLSGHRFKTAFLLIREVVQQDDTLQIRATTLAIGSGFGAIEPIGNRSFSNKEPDEDES